jgi:hypothetical protein
MGLFGVAKMSAKVELIIGAASLVFAFGLIAAIIGEAFR